MQVGKMSKNTKFSNWETYWDNPKHIMTRKKGMNYGIAQPQMTDMTVGAHTGIFIDGLLIVLNSVTMKISTLIVEKVGLVGGMFINAVLIPGLQLISDGLLIILKIIIIMIMICFG